MRLTLPIGLMFTAASALAATPGSSPIVQGGVEINISPLGGRTSGAVVQVTLDVEARSDAAAQRLGFRSMRGLTAIDCAMGANRFIKAEAFAQPDLEGPSTPRVVSGGWLRPSAGSEMAAVTARICSDTARSATASTASGPLPVVTLARQPAQTPAATTAAVPAPAAPANAPPARIAMATSSTPAAASPAPRAFRASATGRGVAQVAASDTAQGAQHVLDRLHSLITPPLAGGVEAATVQNVHVFRASVSGFASLGDAQAFCARAASVSKTCWVHWKTAEPARPGAAPARHP